jgi:hypothetical protein
MASSAPKRKRGERNPMHEQRLRYLSAPRPSTVPQEANDAVIAVSKLFSKTAEKYLETVDALDVRDEGRVTAVLDALTAASVVAHSGILLPYHQQPAAK